LADGGIWQIHDNQYHTNLTTGTPTQKIVEVTIVWCGKMCYVKGKVSEWKNGQWVLTMTAATPR